MAGKLAFDRRDWIAGLEKGLRVIEAFNDAHPRLTPSTAARRTGITRTAARRYLRTLHPPEVRIAIVLDNFSPHLSTVKDPRVGDWAAANNVELAYVPFYASWLKDRKSVV